MAELFNVVQVNPNDSVGGGGCLCSESKQVDCKPPYVVFYAQEMENNLSPHAVACAGCIRAAAEVLDVGEVLAGGEADPIDAEAVEEIPDL